MTPNERIENNLTQSLECLSDSELQDLNVAEFVTNAWSQEKADYENGVIDELVDEAEFAEIATQTVNEFLAETL